MGFFDFFKPRKVTKKVVSTETITKVTKEPAKEADQTLSVRKVAEEIVAREGGYVNDPDDPGGATKWGVTIGTLKSIRGKATIADIKALTKEDAVEIFLEYYYERPNIKLLPIILQDTVFDMQVNAGNNAIKILQKMVCVNEDGILGPNTLKAVDAHYKKFGDYIRDEYSMRRRDYYFNLANRKPTLRKYFMTQKRDKGGWVKRAEEFMLPKYRWSKGDFEKVVSRW